MRLRSHPVSLLEGSTSSVGVAGAEAAGGGLSVSSAQVRHYPLRCSLEDDYSATWSQFSRKVKALV